MARTTRPCFVIVGGINGSGKSTFAKRAAGTPLLLRQTAINPDDLTRDATAKFGTLDQTGANLIACVHAARRRQFCTRLIFVALPTVDLALERIWARVAEGGHGVPEQKVRERWIKAHDNLAEGSALTT